MAGWIVLLTERCAAPGRVRVRVIRLSRRGNRPLVAADLQRAWVCPTREEAEVVARRATRRWCATVVPAEGEGLPALR